jgi:3-dehydroquinate synthase
MKSSLTYLKKFELFKELDNYKEGQLFAIADPKLKNHLPQWISFSPSVYWLKNPEEEKNLETYQTVVEFFLSAGISRASTIYAIGGGATTDFAGFVAATILRGVSWVSIPTSLLGMIDGSIGGKVALNMPQGKNLVGAFHMPERVLICGEFLTSLPDKEWLSGKGEVLKYGFLSQEIHRKILNKSSIENIALACAQLKNEIVEKDFHDKGDRIYLNLGHTLGHAFEFTLKIPHGIAVAMGLKYIFSIMKNSDALREWENMATALSLPLEKLELTYYKNFDLKLFLGYIEQDKKKMNASIRLVLVRAIGQCYLEQITLKDFKAKISSHAEFANT